ncbi:SAM-dependent methyltransferase [Prauserella marina]|nr:methyltransferase domain-containing protein [Prauserella marina]ASR36179.1 SAM-dependent methyltransferase [Prauserella marina]
MNPITSPDAPATAPVPDSSLSVFLSAALRRPRIVGGVAPSSRELTEVLASVVPSRGEPTVVELGPGTGATTSTIARRLPESGRQLAVEIDPVMAAHLANSYPGVTVLQGDAAELGALLAREGQDTADAIVSGLPWSLFPGHVQRAVLRQVCSALTPAGAFSTFAYRHAARLEGARRFRGLLDEYFDEVVVTRTVWRNLPPARVFVCRRPRSFASARHG